MVEDPRPIAVSLLGEPSPADGIALIVGPLGATSVVRIEYPDDHRGPVVGCAHPRTADERHMASVTATAKWTIHTAGPARRDTGWVQPCVHCGFVLQDHSDTTVERDVIAESGDPNWWGEGALVGTDITTPGGEGCMYERIHGQPLRDDERLCTETGHPQVVIIQRGRMHVDGPIEARTVRVSPLRDCPPPRPSG